MKNTIFCSNAVLFIIYIYIFQTSSHCIWNIQWNCPLYAYKTQQYIMVWIMNVIYGTGMKNNKKRTLTLTYFPSYSVYQFINNKILHILYKKNYTKPHTCMKEKLFFMWRSTKSWISWNTFFICIYLMR